MHIQQNYDAVYSLHVPGCMYCCAAKESSITSWDPDPSVECYPYPTVFTAFIHLIKPGLIR